MRNMKRKICDNCGKEFLYPFFDEDELRDYADQKKKLKAEGWITTKVNDQWRDFCDEACRNSYIKKNTI